jgi:predicted DNA-binding transcriptional regulator AlpA
MSERLLDITDLAGLLKVPAKTIRNKLSDGSWPIKPLRIGRSLRWRPADVEAFLGPRQIDRDPKSSRQIRSKM